MRSYREVEVYFHRFLAPAPKGNKVVDIQAVLPRKNGFPYPPNRGMMGGGRSHGQSGYLKEDKFSCPCQQSKQDSSVVRAIALSLFGICKTDASFSRRSEFNLMFAVDGITQQ